MVVLYVGTCMQIVIFKKWFDGVLFQLLTTPYVPATRNPRWESWVEFFVGDFSQVGFDIYLCDYIFYY